MATARPMRKISPLSPTGTEMSGGLSLNNQFQTSLPWLFFVTPRPQGFRAARSEAWKPRHRITATGTTVEGSFEQAPARFRAPAR